MHIQWFINKQDYEAYQRHQHEYKDGDCDGDYIGSARTGNLCFDVVNWGNHLWFDLYVGGVDSGYGYSDRNGFEHYPYDYADSVSFRWDKDVKETSLEEFKEELSKYIKEHLNVTKKYNPYFGVDEINLLDKANEALQLW